MLRIEYPFNVGGQLKDRRMWMSTRDGVVVDYNSKQALIKEAEDNGEPYEIITRHRDGTITTVQHGVSDDQRNN